MIQRFRDGEVSWQTLVMIFSVATVVAGAAIWIGSIAKQTDINTADIKRIYDYIAKIVDHDATTTAEHKGFERRLDEHERRFEKIEKLHQ